MEAEAVTSAIVDGLLIGGAYALVAMGLAMIWGVMEIINFAHGDFMMLGALAAYYAFTLMGLDPLAGGVLAFVMVFALGVGVQRGVINRILDAPLLTQIAATFAVLLIIRYGVQAVLGPYTRRLVTWYQDYYVGLGFTTVPLSKLLIFLVSLVILALLYILLNRTDMGIAIRATSQNRMVAQLMGINVSRVYDVTFGIGVGVAAVGGALVALFYPIFPEMGGFFALIAFIAVVLGGFGNVYGAYVGGLIIGVTESVSALFIEPALKDVVAFLLFILIIMIKPTGLFGRGE
ncbi:branched-chain amino acid ABC transporter, permease protein [Aeropyrum pernix K1]|uniref:Branched-chain amino acid ABC transporter, permease protein n=1 Tax=Aeropyrum pernix (strain ATCC 700893 / DSM 11879 / JCM 9820 / NBRC 100138 / K1) TaxID=272557 RepID=Q9Y8W2_AERPE|nr:branched-chain amino acid ABC transporter permease [Aeropyrum pernix]BAA81538.2 branched-chain amino acid ABC transporter, permease protein [Aeropyrum pernix K1]